jgi:Tol biopolymer transport system component
VAWSPDGKKIAYSRFQPDNVLRGVDLLDLQSAKVRALGRYSDRRVAELQWLTDGHALLALYQDSWTRVQVGSISYPGGQLQPVTRDTNRYATLTLSADGKSLATVQVKTTQSLFVIPGGGTRDKTALLVFSHPQIQPLGFNWASERELLVSSTDGLVRMGSEGNDRTTLLSDQGIFTPSTCGTRYLVFSLWTTTGTQIWRTDADGSNRVRLTDGKGDVYPVCSVDSKWVYHLNNRGSTNQVWRVLLSGGKSEVVPGSVVPNSMLGVPVAISPDGKLAAYGLSLGESEQEIGLLNLASEGLAAPRLLNPDPRIASGVQFAPDGKGVAYSVRNKGVDNIWIQPLDGAPGRQITNFASDWIAEFHWSPDGKTIGVIRNHTDSDVVLLT